MKMKTQDQRTHISFDPIPTPSGAGHTCLTIYPPGQFINNAGFSVFLGGGGHGERKTLEAELPQPGEGWVLLEEGEPLRAGDGFLNPDHTGGIWIDFECRPDLFRGDREFAHLWPWRRRVWPLPEQPKSEGAAEVSANADFLTQTLVSALDNKYSALRASHDELLRVAKVFGSFAAQFKNAPEGASVHPMINISRIREAVEAVKKAEDQNLGEKEPQSDLNRSQT